MESNLPGDLGPALHDRRRQSLLDVFAQQLVALGGDLTVGQLGGMAAEGFVPGASSGSMESVLVLLENPLLRHLLKKRRDCLAQLLAIVREIFHQKIYEVV